MIFTELFELVEKKFGYDFLDEVIEGAELANDGAYTATGNYSFDELVKIVTILSEKSSIPIPTLLEVYGEHLFPKLITIFSTFNHNSSVIEFIAHVEDYIHIEVKKLYPDAELPSFDILSQDENAIVFNYISKKRLHHLAKGLIVGAGKYFDEEIEIKIVELGEDIRMTVSKI